jgi:hypothetical protein
LGLETHEHDEKVARRDGDGQDKEDPVEERQRRTGAGVLILICRNAEKRGVVVTHAGD